MAISLVPILVWITLTPTWPTSPLLIGKQHETTHINLHQLAGIFMSCILQKARTPAWTILKCFLAQVLS